MLKQQPVPAMRPCLVVQLPRGTKDQRPKSAGLLPLTEVEGVK